MGNKNFIFLVECRMKYLFWFETVYKFILSERSNLLTIAALYVINNYKFADFGKCKEANMSLKIMTILHRFGE